MKTITISRKLTALVLAVLIFGMSTPAYAAGPVFPIPIPPQPDARPVPVFIGQEAEPNPIVAPNIPVNPYMSTGAWSVMHNDTYMSDTYFTPGPLGHLPKVSSTFLGLSQESPVGLVPSIAFDKAGRLIAGPVLIDFATGQSWVRLVLIEPESLKPLAMLNLPSKTWSGNYFRPSGVYFYQDQLDRILVGTPERTIWVVTHSYTPPFQFSLERTYDLKDVIAPDDEIEALQPDFSGRLWFTTKGGMVGTLDMGKSSDYVLGAISLPGEEIVNGTSADETGGVYIASTQAMYRFDADQNGAPSITWREAYDAGTHVKAGQINIGTGTTPTLMGRDFVTLTDNAEPQMHVLVYRRAKEIPGSRLVCAEPVFRPGNSSTENSLVATDKSIIVENNFGYKDYKTTLNGSTSKPGITRIDLDEDGNGCHTVWTNTEEVIPTVVTKMSLASGLIYTYTKPKGPANTDAWYFTAIDFHTGKTVYSMLAGTGILYNNHYAALTLGPNGTAYVGVLGGLVAIRDSQ
jgi:hypothetical protein